MAKLNQQTLVITVSQLLRDDTDASPLMSPDMVASIEAVIQQLAEDATQSQVLVEVQQA